MGACNSKKEDERANEKAQDFSKESSFYGKITQHNPLNAAGEVVTVRDLYDFDEELELGASSTGVVCKAIRKADGEEFALKVIHLDKINAENREQLRSEIEILKSLDHPNIVKLFETFELDNVLYMIMELCTGGELYGRLAAAGKRFSEDVVCRIVRQMLSAVVYCHSKNIAHRDIKMANFLFKDDSPDAPVKMIDFGYSKMMYKMGGMQRLETFVGTSYFIAPEVIAGAYSEKADIWSIGVMCFLMVVGYAPFRGKNPQEILENVRKAKINWNTPRWKKASKGCLNFTKALLTVNENKRLTAEEALKHPWLESGTAHLVPNFSDQMLVNMSNFADTARLKQLAKVVIAHCAHRDFVQPYHDAFFAIDHDNSGRIDKEELVAALMEHNGLDQSTANEIFDAIDYDGNGTIRFSEFVAAAIGDTFTDAHIKDAFKRLCLAPIPSTATTPATPLTPATPATPAPLSLGSPSMSSDLSGQASTSLAEAAGTPDPEHVPLVRVASVVDKVITPQSLHDAYEEHDLETCQNMIAEATAGKESMTYQDFVQFMRAADSIVLENEEDALDDAGYNDSSSGGGGKARSLSGEMRAGSRSARNVSPSVILTNEPRASRPELLRQISGVVANKPSSNKRRESLRVLSNPHLAAAAIDAQRAAGSGSTTPSSTPSGSPSQSRRKNGVESDEEEEEEVRVILSQDTMGTIPSVGSAASSPRKSTDDDLFDEELDEELQSVSMSATCANDLGKRHGKKWACSPKSTASRDSVPIDTKNAAQKQGAAAGAQFAQKKAAATDSTGVTFGT